MQDSAIEVHAQDAVQFSEISDASTERFRKPLFRPAGIHAEGHIRVEIIRFVEVYSGKVSGWKSFCPFCNGKRPVAPAEEDSHHPGSWKRSGKSFLHKSKSTACNGFDTPEGQIEAFSALREYEAHRVRSMPLNSIALVRIEGQTPPRSD